MSYIVKFLVSVLVFTILSQFTVSAAQDEDWADDWGDEKNVEQPLSHWQYSGFLEAALGQFLQSNITGSAAQINELRLRAQVSYSHDLFEFSAKADWLYDDVLSQTLWQTRVFNVAASPIDNLDVKIGRQVLTWGTGDLLFLNDRFAKDWQSFFSGRDDEYLKAPSNSLRLTYYVNDLAIDLAWTPQFTPDHYLSGERFSYYSPTAQQLVAASTPWLIKQTNDAQWSMRLATSIQGVEYALYGYHGFWNTPQGVDTQQHGYFPTLNSFGASMRLPLGSGLFNAEVATYNSTEDNQGDNPLIANGQQRLLLGYEQEAAKNFTVGVQYYVEKTKDFGKLENPLTDQYRQLFTIRFRYSTMQQKMTYSLFVFYSPTDKDSYIRPSINYRQDDQWSFAVGANVFGGENNVSFFGQHQDNSNAWARIRYQY
jgi:hypothetical protein